MTEWVTTCNRRPEWLQQDTPEAEAERWSLVIIWSADEPERIGESAFIDESAGELVLGRGDATPSDPSERLHFVRSRPARMPIMPPLAGEGLSRRQCVVQAVAAGVFVRNLGRAELLVDGTPHTSGIVSAGQVLHVKDRLSLYCSLQSTSPRLRYFDLTRAPNFGEADEFGIVGEHRAAWELREQLAFAAASERHVLLLGESGTGKELAARALHQLSARSAQPMLARNAATLPAAVVDAELFGTAADWPTAGVPERRGVIGEADGTTLFLDELGELSAELQAHLLRVLDSGGEYQRLGDARCRRSDFRLVAATNRDPTELRSDLVGRLTLQLQLPGLIDRREDIPLLVRHLLVRAAQGVPELRERFFDATAHGLEPRIHPALMELLMRHRFTLHVRELEQLLWKALSDSPKNFVALTRSVRQLFNPAAPARSATTLSTAGKELGAEDIVVVLEQHGGNVAKAAEALGVKSRYAMYRLMRRHGIAVERVQPAKKLR